MWQFLKKDWKKLIVFIISILGFISLFLLDCWKVIVSILNNNLGLGALVVALLSAIKYFDQRNNELSWKRTEFLFKQAEMLDNDAEIKEILQLLLLKQEQAEKEIEQIIDNDNTTEKLRKLDKFLNFMDRLVSANLLQKTIKKSEITNFGWYFLKIRKNEPLKKYCNENGFDQLLTVDIER